MTYDDDKIDSFDNEGRQICRLYHKQTTYSRLMPHTLVDGGSIPPTSTNLEFIGNSLFFKGRIFVLACKIRV